GCGPGGRLRRSAGAAWIHVAARTSPCCDGWRVRALGRRTEGGQRDRLHPARERWLSMADFLLSDMPLDIAALRAQVLDRRAGGYASFEGWVRDHHAGRAVDGLDYEAYA